MSFKLADRVKQTATTTGTGAITLSATPTGYRAFSSVLSVSDTCYYTIAHQTANEWEVGYGTYSGVNTLTRTYVISSSNSGSAVSFSAGTKDVFITLPATGGATNVVLGSEMGFDPLSYGSTVAIGVSVSVNSSSTIAIGSNVAANGNDATIVGQSGSVGQYSSAFGSNSNASSTSATAIGASANAGSSDAVAVGAYASASQQYNTAVGTSASASGNNKATAVGYQSSAGGELSVAIGASTTASNQYTTAVGGQAFTGGDYSTSIGGSASTTSSYGTAVGASASAAANSIALGANASATYNDSMALGTGAITNNSNSVAVGRSASAGQYGTSVGDSANASSGYGFNNTAIGSGSSATGNATLAVGANATVNGSYNDSIAVGTYAQANSSYSVALGTLASANYDYATVLGRNSSVGGNEATAVGHNVQVGQSSVGVGSGISASVNTEFVAVAHSPINVSSKSVLIGRNGATYKDESIVIGYGSNDSSGGGSTGITVIGPNITTASQPGATYMNRFRTGVTPVGTSWYLKWDDSTKEVYADPGPAPSGPNWVTYQDNGMSPVSLNLDVPSGAPTSSPYSAAFFSPNVSPPPPWMYYSGLGGGMGNLYSNSSYPLTSPITGSMFSGPAVCFLPMYSTDPGTSSTYAVALSSAYSNSSSQLYMYSGFPVFGSTRYGHYIAAVSGNFVGGFSPSSGCTLADEFYDMWGGYTYFFIDLDSSAISSLSAGSPCGSFPGYSSYLALFWYNYS